MSDAMGPLTFGKKEEQIFLGREIAQHQDYSEDTAIRIDQEIKRIVTTNYERAQDLLEAHRVAARPDCRGAARARSARRRSGPSHRRGPAARGAQAAAAPPAPPRTASQARPKERPAMVPPMPPLNKPLTQE